MIGDVVRAPSPELIWPEYVYVAENICKERICKNCKWWNVPVSVGYCEHPKLNCDIGFPEGEDFLATDDSYVVTGPCFGCIHWEVAPEDEPK